MASVGTGDKVAQGLRLGVDSKEELCYTVNGSIQCLINRHPASGKMMLTGSASLALAGFI